MSGAVQGAAPMGGGKAGWGVRARLFLAIGAIAATCVVASAASIVILDGIGRRVDATTSRELPTLIGNFALADAASRLVRAEEALLGASTHDQRRQQVQSLAPLTGAIDEAVRRLEALEGRTPALQQVNALVAELGGRIRELDGAVERRIDGNAARQAALAKAEAAHAAVMALMAPLASQLQGDIAMTSMSIGGDPASSTKMLLKLLSQDVPLLQALDDVGGQLNLAAALVGRAAGALRPDALEGLQRDFAKEVGQIEERLDVLLALAPTDGLREAVGAFLAASSGREGVFARRAEELAAAERARSIHSGTASRAGELLALASASVAAVGKETMGSGVATAEAVRFGSVVMAVVAAVGVLGAGLVMWLYVGRSLVRRIVGLDGMMTRLAGGDLAAEIPRSRQRDEIGRMVEALIVFRDSIIRARALAEEQDAERAAKAERGARLEALVGGFEVRAGASVASVSSAAAQLKATATAMAGSTEACARESDAIASAARDAGANVQMVAAAAEQLAASIHEIARQVGRSADMAGRAADDARRTDKVVRALADAAQRIGDVVGLINNIAGQTNLLALNATIEAARAGDAGKGFAVVASEVKNLAAQTARATDDIGHQIAAIQAATQEAVGAIEAIAATIGDVNDISASIAAAVEEQGAATQEIARNVQQAADGTLQVNQGISGVDANVRQTGDAAAQVLAASGNLADQAQLLRDEVGHFIEKVKAA